MTTALSRQAALAKGALLVYLSPRLALDAQIDLNPLVAGITAKNFDSKRGVVESAVRKAVEGRLAKDADIDDIADLLEAIGEMKEEEEVGDDLGANSGLPMGHPHSGAIMQYLHDKLPPEHCAHVAGLLDDDESAEDKAARDSYHRRAADAREKLGRDESEEERDERDKKESAEDAKKRLGRDETEEECSKREAMDRLSHGVYRARDAMHRARDSMRSAHDAHMKKAEDQEAMDAYKSACDAFKEACDTFHGARGARDAELYYHPAKAKEKKDAKDEKDDDDKDDDKDDVKNAKDEPADFEGKPKVGGGHVTRRAMDEAIQRAVKENDLRHRAVRDAEDVVRPWVGNLPTVAFDSAEAVYRAALSALGIKNDHIHESALKTVLEMQPRGAKPQNRLATDAAPAKSFAERFPAANRISIV